MSLRLRLTILYSALTGGILLVFGILLFSLVNYLLINQVDNTLAQTYDTIVARTHINSVLNIAFVPDLDLNSNVLVQVWGSDGTLKLSSRTIAFLTQPLDPSDLNRPSPPTTMPTSARRAFICASLPNLCSMPATESGPCSWPRKSG